MTTCLGCGCTDDHACVNDDDFTAGCHWLEVDVDKQVGICSACDGFLGFWHHQGRRTPVADFTQIRVVQLLRDIYNEHDALEWYLSRQLLLNNAAPHDLIVANRIREVRQVIDQIRDGVYL